MDFRAAGPIAEEGARATFATIDAWWKKEKALVMPSRS
jgi:hypothetical protein